MFVIFSHSPSESGSQYVKAMQTTVQENSPPDRTPVSCRAPCSHIHKIISCRDRDPEETHTDKHKPEYPGFILDCTLQILVFLVTRLVAFLQKLKQNSLKPSLL